MRLFFQGLSAVALTVALSGCATVTRGSTDKFTIETTPVAAQAHTSSGFNCESTPCTIRMPRKDAFTVTITKAGYKTVTAEVKPKLASSGAAGFVGNALIGGVIGAAVDVGSGATLDLKPNPLHVDLEPDVPAAPVVASATAPAAPVTGAAAPVAASPAATSTSAPPANTVASASTGATK